MLSLTHETTLSVLRAVATQHGKAKHTDMLPSAGTPERTGLINAVSHLFGARSVALPDTSITLGEWAQALIDHTDIEYLNLHDTTSSAFCDRLQRCYRHTAANLSQEAKALKAMLALPEAHERRLISWLSLQSVSGFVLGALLPQEAGWQARSLFDNANALWELNTGDVIATDSQRWRQLAARLPALPDGITAITTTPLDAATRQTLEQKGVADIVELYSEPALGVIAARRSPDAPFELLSHWHPTESHNYLLRLTPGSAMQEVKLAEPLEWVGARSFERSDAGSQWPGYASSQASRRYSAGPAHNASAA